ncbi:OsmC family protein [Afifella sp. IM 167]|uniref:OsmC family protein n=1 Tax=Afifella sp. IM 167 TaxID=2033586 RepID=UPI001CCCD73B|nr:OsmC family protein [Afifella sp. IM 167]
MSSYFARIVWSGDAEEVRANKHSRVHEWQLDEGLKVPASPGPAVLPAAVIREDAVDPEEGLVASLSSCHMLFFLDLIRKSGFTPIRYEDEAEGVLGVIEPRRKAIVKVILRPKTVFDGEAPDHDKLEEIHHKAHELCFIANSLKSEIVVDFRE